MECWHVLGIEPTENIVTIKKAFARLLKEFPPEKDALKYQELRKAFNQAVASSKGEMRPEPLMYPAASSEPSWPTNTEETESHTQEQVPVTRSVPTDTPEIDLEAIQRIQNKFGRSSVKIFADDEEARLYNQTCIWERIKKVASRILLIPFLLGFFIWYTQFDKGSYRMMLLCINALIGVLLFFLPLFIVRSAWPHIDYGPLMRKQPLTCLIVKHLFTIAVVIVFYNLFKIMVITNSDIRYNTSLINSGGVVTMLLSLYECFHLRKDVVYDKK